MEGRSSWWYGRLNILSLTFISLLQYVTGQNAGWDDCVNKCVLGPLIGNYAECNRFAFDCVCTNLSFRGAVTDCVPKICSASGANIASFTSSLCGQAALGGGATKTVTAVVTATVANTATIVQTATITVGSAGVGDAASTTTVIRTTTITETEQDTETRYISSVYTNNQYSYITSIAQEDASTITRVVTSVVTSGKTVTVTGTTPTSAGDWRSGSGSATPAVTLSSNYVPAATCINSKSATGIGIGSAVGGMVLLAAVGALLLLKRRRDERRDHQHGAAIYMPGQTHDENEAMAGVGVPKRKPVPELVNTVRQVQPTSPYPDNGGYAVPAAMAATRQSYQDRQDDAINMQQRRAHYNGVPQGGERDGLLGQQTGYYPDRHVMTDQHQYQQQRQPPHPELPDYLYATTRR